MGLPATVDAYKVASKRFHPWLVENGSAILKPTNPYEVSRFLTDGGIGVVYRNQADRITSWANGASKAFLCFERRQPWRAADRGRRVTSKRDRIVATLAERDGWGCMYCPCTLTTATATLEHVLSVTHGGPAHPANLALACKACNDAASHLSAREKVELAIKGRNA